MSDNRKDREVVRKGRKACVAVLYATLQLNCLQWQIQFADSDLLTNAFTLAKYSASYSANP